MAIETMWRLRREIAGLSPGYGAWVMATGIVSTGFALFGDPALSDALLVITCAAFALLLVAYTWRVVGYWPQTRADARNPSRAFGYFSMVAAANVIAVRLALADHPSAALVLGAASLPLWLILTYGILGAMVIGPREGSMLPGVNGSWFLLVVATQSLSVTSSIVGASHPELMRAMAALAVALWAIGVVLYLILAVVVTLHLLELNAAPHALSPTYWIYMGATAISVLAAARILQFHTATPVIVATRDVVSGLGFLLWAFGSWWMPLLLGFAIGRHVLLHEHLHYEPAWWSMVFPLGMYAVASAAFGRATRMGFMVDIGRGEVWLGFIAWLGVCAAMIGSLLPAGAPGAGDSEARGAIRSDGVGAIRSDGVGAIRSEGPEATRSAGPGARRSETPGAIRSEGPGAIRSAGPGALRSETPGTLRSEGPGTLRSEGPGALRSETPGAIRSEARDS